MRSSLTKVLQPLTSPDVNARLQEVPMLVTRAPIVKLFLALHHTTRRCEIASVSHEEYGKMKPGEHLIRMAVMLGMVAAGPVPAGDLGTMVENCDGCHGPAGVSDNTDMPTIAGISDLVHFDALYAYADGARPCATSKYLHGDKNRAATDMCAVVADMTEADMEAVSQYYAAKPFVAAKQGFDATLAARGRAIHAEACEKCHTEGGSVAEDDAGILAGQQMGYLRKTFAQCVAGEREQPRSMKARMDALSAEETEALIHFYASQQ